MIIGTDTLIMQYMLHQLLLTNNELYYVYVSPGGSDELGNGSINNPFKTIKHALNKVINKGIVYVLGR